MPWPKTGQLITMHSWDLQTKVMQKKSCLSTYPNAPGDKKEEIWLLLVNLECCT